MPIYNLSLIHISLLEKEHPERISLAFSPLAMEPPEEEAELRRPGNHGLAAAKSLLYIRQGRLAEAERLLRLSLIHI